MLSKRIIFTLSLVAVLPLAVAQEEPASRGFLELKTTVEKVSETMDETGTVKTELLPLDTAVPGDEVVYTVTFRNIGDATADNILITNPIPAEIRYVEGSAFGPGTAISYSADGGETYGEPAELRVQNEDGVARIASADEYTHIRWQLTASLDAGAQGFTRFRAVVR